MMLYAMSVIDKEKFENLSKQMSKVLADMPIEEVVPTPEYEVNGETLPEFDAVETPDTTDDFDEVYEQLKEKIEEYGYEDIIALEKGEGYLNFRFGDNALFYPDSAVMKNENTKILKDIGDILNGIDHITQSIEIGGHTAVAHGGVTSSFFAWELSADRAIAVLKFLVNECHMPQSKMVVAGYSRYHPVAPNDNEESRKLNRRVEIKITRVQANQPSANSS